MTLRFINISKTCPLPYGLKVVLDDISATIPSGTISALIGPSGGGKTTLLRLLNRLDDPTSGKIFLDEQDITTIDPLLLRRTVSLLPQKPLMFPGTVRDNLRMPLALHGLPQKTDTQQDELLRRCQLEPELLGQIAKTLSIGQQQRVALARTLLLEPQVLLLDEPTGALDRRTADRLANLLIESGLTVVMISHDLRLCERVATQLLYLENGKLIETGPPTRLLNHPRSVALRDFLAEPETVKVADE
ncbi:MAG: ATP-binding cassette domain-containing protein [Desulfuromonadales bacterium]|nr:ATP-binding cassette domain-containing protein [Desulfuromonadales bacterium]